MRDSHAPGHDYHLVDPSPWPAIGALSVFVLAGGLIWFMHEGPPWMPAALRWTTPPKAGLVALEPAN